MNFEWGMLVVIALVAYPASVIVALNVANYFFGDSGADKVQHTYGAPIGLVLWLIEVCASAASLPWTYRNKRLLREVFNIYPDDDYLQARQSCVDEVLDSLARGMENRFTVEEELRRQRPQDKEMLAIAKADAVWAKKQFWSAHALARRNRFVVHTTYGDYLKNTSNW